jgi:uncharacterized protein YqeY
MTIKERLKADMIAAMKGKEKRLEAIRFVLAAIKKQEVDTRKDLDDTAVIAILSNLVKQRRDSIEQFGKGGRQDLVDKEEAELLVLQGYLPQQLSREELAKIVDEAVAQSGAKSAREMGAVMKILMPKVAGRAEGSAISELVKSKLSG